MKKNDTVFLQHILEAINQIEVYTSNVSYEQFLQERLLQDGVVRQLEIIGEASRNLSADFRDQHPEISWRQIIGLRNRVVHAYFELNLTIIWEVVENDLPVLKQGLEQLV
jgi:uncharacterized protein with HEPN domain